MDKTTKQKAGMEGYYLVMASRALHWPTSDGKPRIWARAGQVVDLRSEFLCEIVQRTGQMHKLERVEEIKEGVEIVTTEDIPAAIRSRMAAYEASGTAPHKVLDESGKERQIDLTDLPRAKPSAVKAEKAAPEPATPPAAPKAAPRSSTAKKGAADAQRGGGGDA